MKMPFSITQLVVIAAIAMATVYASNNDLPIVGNGLRRAIG